MEENNDSSEVEMWSFCLRNGK